jgi:hypothetical protein
MFQNQVPNPVVQNPVAINLQNGQVVNRQPAHPAVPNPNPVVAQVAPLNPGQQNQSTMS